MTDTENEQNLYTLKEPAAKPVLPYKTAFSYAHQFRWAIAVTIILCFAIYEYHKGLDVIHQAEEMTRQNVMLEDRQQAVKVLEACGDVVKAGRVGL